MGWHIALRRIMHMFNFGDRFKYTAAALGAG